MACYCVCYLCVAACVHSLDPTDHDRRPRAAAFCTALPGRPREHAALAVRLRRPSGMAGGLRQGHKVACRGRGRVAGVAAHALGLGDEGGADAALLEAAQDGDAARVQRALAGGASVAATNDWGTTCLHLSVKGGHAEVTCQSEFVWGVRAVPLIPAHTTRWLACSSKRALTPIAPRFRHQILKVQ